MMPRIAKLARLLQDITLWSAMLCLLLAVLWGVLTRYVTESPAVWTTELSGILFTWVVFVGAVSAFSEGRHIRVTLLLDALPDGASRLLRFAGDLLVAVFLCYGTWLALGMMELGATRFSPVMRVPFSWVYLAVVISFAAMSVTAVLRLLGLAEEPAGEAGEEISP